MEEVPAAAQGLRSTKSEAEELGGAQGLGSGRVPVWVGSVCIPPRTSTTLEAWPDARRAPATPAIYEGCTAT
eukprot:7324615-Prymnesium_polylepis.1